MNPQESGSPSQPEQNSAPGTSQSQDNKSLYAILAYLGPLVIISYLREKQDPFVKHHIKQGLVVFSIEVVSWVLMGLISPLWMIWNLVNLTCVVLSVVGIVNVVHKEQKELPVVGSWANNFKF